MSHLCHVVKVTLTAQQIIPARQTIVLLGIVLPVWLQEY